MAGAHSPGRTVTPGRVAGVIALACGPALTKFAQLLATRTDLVGPCFSRDLAAVVSRRRSDGQHRGSIGHVSNVDGQAVKTIPRLVRARVRVDCLVIQTLCAAASLVPRWAATGVPELVDELAGMVKRQVDLDRERHDLAGLAHLEDSLPVRVPQVSQLSSHEALVQEWLPGQGQHVPNQQVATVLLQTIFTMIFETGVVHCDLHPGNWWVLPDGRVAIVDAGFVVRLTRTTQATFSEFFLGFASGDGDRCVDQLLKASLTVPPCRDEAGLRQRIRALVSESHNRDAGSFSLPRFAAELFAAQHAHQLRTSSEFVLPLVALLALEGQVRDIDPTVPFQRLAVPSILRGMRVRASTPAE